MHMQLQEISVFSVWSEGPGRSRSMGRGRDFHKVRAKFHKVVIFDMFCKFCKQFFFPQTSLWNFSLCGKSLWKIKKKSTKILGLWKTKFHKLFPQSHFAENAKHIIYFQIANFELEGVTVNTIRLWACYASLSVLINCGMFLKLKCIHFCISGLNSIFWSLND